MQAVVVYFKAPEFAGDTDEINRISG